MFYYVYLSADDLMILECMLERVLPHLIDKNLDKMIETIKERTNLVNYS